MRNVLMDEQHDPAIMVLQEELESVQKRAARFVTGNYKYETGSMTGIRGQLKWESLKKRRKDNRLILLYIGLKGKASIPTDDLIPKTSSIQYHYSGSSLGRGPVTAALLLQFLHYRGLVQLLLSLHSCGFPVSIETGFKCFHCFAEITLSGKLFHISTVLYENVYFNSSSSFTIFTLSGSCPIAIVAP